MPAHAITDSKAMNDLASLNPKVTMTPLGLEVHEELTHAEWCEIGARIGGAMRSIAFVVGDWLVYGEGRDGQRMFWPDVPEHNIIPHHLYEKASQLTGMDITTLHNHAYVARHVPRWLRNEKLAWEHHKRVAKLKDDAEKARWLKLAVKASRNGRPISARRLARSIQAGRLLSIEEMSETDSDTSFDTVHPHVNRIVLFFGKLRAGGWFDEATAEKRAALKRDLEPVVEIFQTL
jgi:hypothetical protein